MLFKQFRHNYHVTVGFGSPTHRHSNVILPPSSDCRMTGRSVNVGLMPSSGTGASSPTRNIHYTKLGDFLCCILITRVKFFFNLRFYIRRKEFFYFENDDDKS